MDESFNNVVEGTRQYFMGLPKPAQDGSVQQVWATGSPVDEGTPVLSSVEPNSSRPPSVVTAHTSRPPSTAAAPPSTSTPAPINIPSRPPSEPEEPEPHIIHKATVMREAAEKRREQPEIEDEEEAGGALSPPSHIIRKPTPHNMMSSPAPASAVPSPSPVRPPSAASSLPPHSSEQIELSTQYRSSVHRVQTPTIRLPEHFSNSSRADPYTASRCQSEHFMRYQYDPNSGESGRLSHSSSIASPQPSALHRQSPQSYARISSTITQHTSRLNETSIHNSIVNQRYSLPPQPPPPHNDRVPPIHHPQAVPAAKILTTGDIRSSQMYKNRESSSFSRTMSSYERHQTIPQRKYDPQQTYSGYRASQQVASNHSIDKRNNNQYKHGTTDVVNAHYTTRPPDRPILTQQPHVHEHHRVIPRTEYVNKNPTSSKNYNYPVPSTSSVRYVQNTSVPINQNNTSALPRPSYRSAVAPKSSYDYSALNQSHTSSSRPAMKAGYQNPQTKMTVSVTSIVDQMNQTKQRRESPLDLSVKTVKNSADSSTTQDDMVDSASMKNESFTLQPRLTNNRTNVTSYSAYPASHASHKVDFAPDFAQYRGERINASHNYNVSPQPSLPGRHNEAFDQPRPVVDLCSIESRQVFAERTKYQNIHRNDYVPRIDLTRSNSEEPHVENRIRDDRHFIIEDRKRTGGPDISNIPKKIVKYETWSSDSRIDRLSQSAREQRELMSRPVYNYQSYKRFEAFQNDLKRPHLPSAYRDPQPHVSHRYSVSHFPEQTHREVNDYHGSYEKNLSVVNNRHIIQKIPSHRDIHPHLKDMQQPADKKVLSILRNSLEIKQSYAEHMKPSDKIPDLIVIDDGDDQVIDITKETESESTNNQINKNDGISAQQNFSHDIQMPKAVDSITRDDLRYEQSESKTKSPENDVASRIRTKAELKVMPPSQDSSNKNDTSANIRSNETKILPKSQKQHLFNQIREDNLRLESVIKTEKSLEGVQEIKSEPMSIEEIEKDAIRHIKTEHNDEDFENSEPGVKDELDMDWATACDSFMEQLKEGCHKRKPNKRIVENVNLDGENKVVESNSNIIAAVSSNKIEAEADIIINIKQEPKDFEEEKAGKENLNTSEVVQEMPTKTRRISKHDKNRNEKKLDKENEKVNKNRLSSKSNKNKTYRTQISVKKEVEDEVPVANVKEEAESTDDDEPLIKSKLLKEKEQSDRMKYQLLKELAEKSAYVKLECCDDISTRKSLDSINKDKEAVKSSKNKLARQTSKDTRRSKEKTISDSSKNEGINELYSDSDDDVLSVSSRLRVRKIAKSEDVTVASTNKTSAKSSPTKRMDSSSSCSTPLRKSGFGDGSDFHPGWEEELYKYKRSLRMPTRLIAIPRGRSGGPFFFKNCANQLARGSTSLPDLDPVPLSPAPSSAQSAATDDIYRRPDKNILDSDLESNSSCSAFNNKLQYDSEASTSTIFSSTNTNRSKGKSNSIVDVLIKKCGRKDETKKKLKDKEEKSTKILPKSSNTIELLPTPSLGLVKNGNKGNLSAKKEKLMEDIFYLGAFRKETVTMFRTAFINNTNGLIGATEEFAPVVLKSRTRTESRVLKQRATIKEVFGDDRPASAPPTSCREEYTPDAEEESPIVTKKDVDIKNKIKPKTKNKMLRRSSSIRDGLRSTKSLKRNDAKGRMMRLKKRNSLLKSLISTKKNKISSSSNIKVKSEKNDKSPEDNKDDSKEDNSIPSTTETNTKKRFKRLFGRRKFSSGFDYIRKKKKIIRRDNSPKVRRQAPKPSPESVHDIQKEIKGWFINKSIGETHLHRAARLGFTDCVAYCLEKMKADPSAKDNAGFTALHVASAKGHVRIARLLLQYGANVSAAAQGGIRPLHEACENSHVEVIRLLLAYGADPILGTYAGQTPEELADGAAAKLLRLHIADVQGLAVEPWVFPSPAEIIDCESLGCDPLSSPPPASPPPPPDSTIEIQCSEAPLPPFYSLRSSTGQPVEGYWCLLQDITNILQIKSKESLLKQIHCGSGSPKELLREIKTQEFLERAQCHQLLCAGEKVNIRASKVALIRVTDKLRQLLKIETVIVS